MVQVELEHPREGIEYLHGRGLGLPPHDLPAGATAEIHCLTDSATIERMASSTPEDLAHSGARGLVREQARVAGGAMCRRKSRLGQSSIAAGFVVQRS